MSFIPLVDLKAQYRAIRPEIDDAVTGVLERCDFILGGSVDEFEVAFARFIGTKQCVGVASGTDALWMAMHVLGIGPGDKVLLPANTFIATALAVSDAGATPVLVDMDPATYNLDVDAARRALVPGVKAILPVHLYGQPADMQGVMGLAREKGLLVIEDAAQAHGAIHRDGRCGTFGAAAGFSFYPGKNLGAYGDGGAVCTDDEALAQRMRELRNWGGTVKYHHPVRGFNSRLDTIQAAVLGVKLRFLEEWNRRRRQAAAWYREALAPLADEIAPAPTRLPGRSSMSTTCSSSAFAEPFATGWCGRCKRRASVWGSITQFRSTCRGLTLTWAWVLAASRMPRPRQDRFSRCRSIQR